MQELKLLPDGAKALRRRMLKLNLIILATTAVFLCAYAFYTYRNDNFDVVQLISIVVPVVIMLTILTVSQSRRSKKAVANLALWYDGSSITRKIPGLPDLTIHFLELRNVKKLKNGSLCLFGATKQDVIWVPAQIENFAGIEAQLQQYIPEETRTPLSWKRWIPTAVSLVMVASIATIMIADDKGVIIAGAIIFLITAPWMGYEIMKNKHVAPGKKIFPIIAFVAILLQIIVKLAGSVDAIIRLFTPKG